MSLLTVQGLTHTFGDKTVFKGVDFRVNHGDHVGLIGANGVGKSTLMQILSGQLVPDAGEVAWLSGTQVGHLSQHLDLVPGRALRDQLRSAFAHLYTLEAEGQALADAMAGCEPEDLNAKLRRFSVIQEQLTAEGFYDIDVKVDRVAAGLGLTELGLNIPVDSLSGGQRTKVLLAQLLLQQPQVLLLDEPTNYLDTAHVKWLTDYLSGYPHAFVVVSHDGDFLNQIVTVVLHLEHQTLTRYPGNIQAFEEAYELRKRQAFDAFARQQETISRLETYIAKNKARSSTAKQAKSREKQLQKIDRLDPPTIQPKPRFQFAPKVHPTSVVMETSDLVVGYDKPLFEPLNLKVKRGEKIALTGFNGVGKTTVLKTVLGHLPAIGGTVHFGERVVPSYFEQELTIADGLSAMDDVWASYPKLTRTEIREALARCGIKGQKVFQALRTLSGGEQAKVRLCKLMLLGGNWLVLDEPTNHLDAAAKESLREALRAFEGTILLVTHEPEFYEDWVTGIWDVLQWKDKGGTLDDRSRYIGHDA